MTLSHVVTRSPDMILQPFRFHQAVGLGLVLGGGAALYLGANLMIRAGDATWVEKELVNGLKQHEWKTLTIPDSPLKTALAGKTVWAGGQEIPAINVYHLRLKLLEGNSDQVSVVRRAFLEHFKENPTCQLTWEGMEANLIKAYGKDWTRKALPDGQRLQQAMGLTNPCSAHNRAQ